MVAKLIRQPDNKRLVVYVYIPLTKDSVSCSLVSGSFVRRGADSEEEELVAVDLPYILRGLDGMADSPFMEQMDRCVALVCAAGRADAFMHS